DQDSAQILELLKHKTAFKGDSEAHQSLPKIIQQELKDDVKTQVQDTFFKCSNPIFAIAKKKGGWQKILVCRILNNELRTEYFKLKGIAVIPEIIIPNDQATIIDQHQAFHHIRVAEKMLPNLFISFNGQLLATKECCDRRGQNAMQLENLCLPRQYSVPELRSPKVTIRNIASNDYFPRVWQDDPNGQELYQPHADNRVLGLAVEHKSNDSVNDNIPNER
ncbi:MAG: hypothetical protein EZS28_053992, partial [Streblomastix strix]